MVAGFFLCTFPSSNIIILNRTYKQSSNYLSIFEHQNQIIVIVSIIEIEIIRTLLSSDLRFPAALLDAASIAFLFRAFCALVNGIFEWTKKVEIIRFYGKIVFTDTLIMVTHSDQI